MNYKIWTILNKNLKKYHVRSALRSGRCGAKHTSFKLDELIYNNKLTIDISKLSK